ncbi:MAG: PQQ-binding-like beta-propeller repeat protein [Bacteroidales bacterium]|nr:PQQ-binding-like beta-propeller repeat protein [Bacteroidales bacterium]
MRRITHNSLFFVMALFTVTLAINSCTQNWPQFRGPEANMIAAGKNLPSEWGEDNNIRWTYEVNGEGWSSPVVWGNKVIVATAFPEKVTPPPERNRDTPPTEPADEKPYLKDIYRWEVTCLDLESGEEIWKRVAHTGNPRIRKHRATNYASETPVTDGKRLYVYFGMTGLYCYDLDGELLWSKDLGAYATLNGWGTGSSPVVYKDVLYVQVDNEEQSFLVALDSETGEEKWKVVRDEKTNYSTPLIWKNGIRTELVTGGKMVRSYDPATGELHWELFAAGHYIIPSAVADKNHLFIGNAGFRDTPGTFFAVKAGAEGDITPAEGELVSSGVVWSNMNAPTGNPSPLLYNGLLYILSSRGGNISCLDASSGKVIYKEKVEKVGACWASPWLHEDKIYFFDEKGVTSVIKAGRDFELLHQNTLDDKFWASVAITGDTYIIKGVEKMYCIGK